MKYELKTASLFNYRLEVEDIYNMGWVRISHSSDGVVGKLRDSRGRRSQARPHKE
ncbi:MULTISPECIES: hypothetical protein [Thalassobacillus]|uniref:hypothetical protein n=1 Tax=Thalassobacillus TaxID=331971 RepID=UPI00159331F0|nr:hypothetical protein [Thalassobacillus devorans]